MQILHTASLCPWQRTLEVRPTFAAANPTPSRCSGKARVAELADRQIDSCAGGRRSVPILQGYAVTGLVETIWLFIRGEESVRVIRTSTPEGRARLLVYGPGN